jgi:hypothetical protein
VEERSFIVIPIILKNILSSTIREYLSPLMARKICWLENGGKDAGKDLSHTE